MGRRKYAVNIIVNNRNIKYVVVDAHYEKKHALYMTDQIILKLVYQLNDGDFSPNSKDEDFEYYATDNLVLDNKKYKLIWLLQKNEIYIGIVNAYRRKK